MGQLGGYCVGPSERSGAYRIAVVMGTRPEAIKLAPVIRALERRDDVTVHIVLTGQHPDLPGLLRSEYGLAPAYFLSLDDGCLTRRVSMCAQYLAQVMAPLGLQAVVVQGDTLSALAGAMAARRIDVPSMHVEAGLRSGDDTDPYPEESFRRLIGRLARWHCAPRAENAAALRCEGVAADAVAITGNPVVDGLQGLKASATRNGPILAIAHRRESLDGGHRAIAAALAALAQHYPVTFVRHANPRIWAEQAAILTASPVRVVTAMPRIEFLARLQNAPLVITDSGGALEEAVTLAVPCLVMRRASERGEAETIGMARRLSPATPDLPGRMLAAATDLIEHRPSPALRHRARFLFGDGRAGPRIAEALIGWLSDARHDGAFSGRMPPPPVMARQAPFP